MTAQVPASIQPLNGIQCHLIDFSVDFSCVPVIKKNTPFGKSVDIRRF